MAGQFNILSESAVALSRNPLGIIALFIVFIYLFASIPATFSKTITSPERRQLLHFLTIFPVLVLAVFVYLVTSHSAKLYGPSDFKDEENYVKIVFTYLSEAAISRNGKASEIDKGAVNDMVQTITKSIKSKKEAWMSSVLWVDDNPGGNTYERKAFEAVGIHFTLAVSTEEALMIASHNKFAAIISDAGRREGNREGYALLEALRNKCNSTPFFIYASESGQSFECETLKLGGQGNTNDPQKLFEMVTKAIVGEVSSSYSN